MAQKMYKTYAVVVYSTGFSHGHGNSCLWRFHVGAKNPKEAENLIKQYLADNKETATTRPPRTLVELTSADDLLPYKTIINWSEERRRKMRDTNIKIWVDDVRPAPDGYVHLHSVNEAKEFINHNWIYISLIDLDHDAGDYANDGGDYIKILDFINMVVSTDEEVDKPPFSFHFHTMNAVGLQNMRAIINRNKWREV